MEPGEGWGTSTGNKEEESTGPGGGTAFVGTMVDLCHKAAAVSLITVRAGAVEPPVPAPYSFGLEQVGPRFPKICHKMGFSLYCLLILFSQDNCSIRMLLALLLALFPTALG